MEKYKLTQWETETNINFNNKDAEAKVYTCNKALIRKIDKLCENYQEIVCVEHDEYSKTYTMPKSYIKIRTPIRLSDEKRQAMSQRAKDNIHNLLRGKKG
jgi:hypothetical protein